MRLIRAGGGVNWGGSAAAPAARGYRGVHAFRRFGHGVRESFRPTAGLRILVLIAALAMTLGLVSPAEAAAAPTATRSGSTSYGWACRLRPDLRRDAGGRVSTGPAWSTAKLLVVTSVLGHRNPAHRQRSSRHLVRAVTLRTTKRRSDFTRC